MISNPFFFDSGRKKSAFISIMRSIYKGPLNFSTKEIGFYTLIGAGLSYFSWKSATLFEELGAEGTPYLPLCTFSPSFGGKSALVVNIILGWYFTMGTILNVRNSYFHYKIARKLNMPIPWVKRGIKFAIASVLALLASFVVVAIDLQQGNGFYNAFIMGAINTVLNYIGAATLENMVIFSFTYLKNKFYETCFNKQPTLKTGRWIVNQLATKTASLEVLPNDSTKWDELSRPVGYKNYILATSFRKNSSNKQSITSKVITFVIQLIMQAFDKIALYGYLLDTYYSLKSPLKITKNITLHINSDTSKVLTILMSVPYIALSSLIVYETVDSMINLTKTAFHDLINFIKKPTWSKKHWIKLSILLPAAALITTGYFLAYVSSDSSLKLNADYGWKDWWNQYPTAITVTMFNGYGFFIVISAVAKWLIDYLTCSPQKREVLSKHQQTCGFFQSFPNAVDKISENRWGFPFRRPSTSLKVE